MAPAVLIQQEEAQTLQTVLGATEHVGSKGTRTARDDKREIIPKCIITVSANIHLYEYHKYYTHFRKYEPDTQPQWAVS